MDILHSPLLIANSEWDVIFDIDFERSVATRQRILEECYQNRMLILSAHLPWSGLGYIAKTDRYHWTPLSFGTPSEIVL